MINKFFPEFLRNNLLWTEGRRDLLISLMLIVISSFLNYIFLFSVIIFLCFLLFFYRNPTRTLSAELLNDDSLIISPADGKVIFIESCEDSKKISIFLSPLNVHVNWVPINGKIEEVNYKPGKFLMAFKSESSELNERNDVLITNKYGSVLSRQIAGLLARRIACWFSPGRKVHLNEKYGMIKFGSRIDLFLPINVIVNVHVGENVQGGITILGKFTPLDRAIGLSTRRVKVIRPNKGAPEKC